MAGRWGGVGNGAAVFPSEAGEGSVAALIFWGATGLGLGACGAAVGARE
jgi:hypothetical protein